MWTPYSQQVRNLIIQYASNLEILKTFTQQFYFTDFNIENNKFIGSLVLEDFEIIKTIIQTQKENQFFSIYGIELKNYISSFEKQNIFFKAKFTKEHLLEKNSDTTLYGFDNTLLNATYQVIEVYNEREVLLYNKDIQNITVTGAFGFLPTLYNDGFNSIQEVAIENEGLNQISFSIQDNSLTTLNTLDIYAIGGISYSLSSILALNFKSWLSNNKDTEGRYIIVDTSSFTQTASRSQSNKTDANYDITNIYGTSFEKIVNFDIYVVFERNSENTSQDYITGDYTSTGEDIDFKQFYLRNALSSVLYENLISPSNEKTKSILMITGSALDDNLTIESGRLVFVFNCEFIEKYTTNISLLKKPTATYPINSVKINKDILNF